MVRRYKNVAFAKTFRSHEETCEGISNINRALVVKASNKNLVLPKTIFFNTLCADRGNGNFINCLFIEKKLIKDNQCGIRTKEIHYECRGIFLCSILCHKSVQEVECVYWIFPKMLTKCDTNLFWIHFYLIIYHSLIYSSYLFYLIIFVPIFIVSMQEFLETSTSSHILHANDTLSSTPNNNHIYTDDCTLRAAVHFGVVQEKFIII